MKILKYSLILVAIAAFSSCLKSRSDVGGLLTDKGGIVISVVEKAYINTDAQNIGLGYDHSGANFNFSKRPGESVKFFTIKLSQPRETKMTGPITIKVKASPCSALPNSGYTPDPVPAAAINVTDIVVPTSTDDVITVPVFYTVNKALLSAGTTEYGVNFKLTATSQGVISELDNNIDVVINYSDLGVNTNLSDYEGSYNYNGIVTDPAGQFGINNNKTMYIRDGGTQVQYADPYIYGFNGSIPNSSVLSVYNYFTGLRTALFTPTLTISAAGVVTGVAGFTGIALDPAGENKFTYTSNTVRRMNVKYTFPLTTVINGVSTPRTLSVSETFTYNPTQVYF